ncbi:hypothetical protein [Paraburkholderia rhizosphaerae]|uniref:hypothetical protein n=1 Tax=Paraburkholderia rhizosphaerae TaxID=480658 RepID=UPI001416F246|nr:hypothetical protein [Paraburkholderia rhizosphaerae]
MRGSTSPRLNVENDSASDWLKVDPSSLPRDFFDPFAVARSEAFWLLPEALETSFETFIAAPHQIKSRESLNNRCQSINPVIRIDFNIEDELRKSMFAVNEILEANHQ